MPKNILLLDDDSAFCSLVRPVLENQGFTVREARTGSAASHILATEEKQDLLIVDGLLPDIEGIDWIRQTRAANDFTCIVYCSAYWRDPAFYKELTEKLNVSLVLHKPIITEVFSEQIAGLFAEQLPNVIEKGTKKTALENTLAQLSARFGSELPLRLDELDRTLHEIKMDPQNEVLIATARTYAHKLRGTAGSYGFAPVSEAMGKVEDALIELGNHSYCNQVQDAWKEIDSAMAEALCCVQGAYKAGEVMARRVQASPIQSIASARILAVDDDTDLLDLLEKIGQQKLIEIVSCRTAAEALERATTIRCDGVFLDVLLGGEDNSFALARQLRELPGCEDLPIAFMTANAHVYNRIAAAHAGGSLYLTKPLEPDMIEAAVRHLLSVRRQEQPRILVLDDDENTTARVKAILQSENMNVCSLNDPVKILETLHEVNPDLLLLDVLMPGISGFDVCRMLRTTTRWQDLPIVFLTVVTGIETRLVSYQCGGDDYLPKPFVDEELISRVRVKVERDRLLKERADKDAVTGLWLRRPFVEQANSMLAGARQIGFPVTLGLLDLDHFKQINDTKGHLCGDGVLTTFGRLMSRRFRTEDLRGRWGGDEFVAAFHALSKEDAHGAVAKFLEEFSLLPFAGEDGSEFTADTSAGLATFPDDGNSVYDLIQVAERRLYAAKNSGLNQVVSSD